METAFPYGNNILPVSESKDPEESFLRAKQRDAVSEWVSLKNVQTTYQSLYFRKKGCRDPILSIPAAMCGYEMVWKRPKRPSYKMVLILELEWIRV